MNWRPMFTLDPDKTKTAILLLEDYSGLYLVRWLEREGGGYGWLDDSGYMEESDLRSCAGWIPAPADTPAFDPSRKLPIIDREMP